MVRKKLTPEDLKAWEDYIKGKKPKDAPKVSLAQQGNGSSKPLPSKPSPSKTKPSPTAMQRKEVNSIKIQATLDLHGLSLTQGRDAFESFVQQCMSRGYKNLLVITGKGALHSSQTLRRHLPLWLQDDPFRSCVISYANPVKPQHGGAGAFYIVLRKKKLP